MLMAEGDRGMLRADGEGGMMRAEGRGAISFIDSTILPVHI